MQQIARTRSRVWFSIVFKKVPVVALRSNRLPSFIGDKGLEICKRKLPRRALNTLGWD
jgi:hypothetical protein